MTDQYVLAVAVVPLADEIDLANSAQVYDQLWAAFDAGAGVVVADFTATQFCDCGSLRRLSNVHRRATARGGELRLLIPPGNPVRRLAWLLGLDRRLPIYASLTQAMALTRPACHRARPGPRPAWAPVPRCPRRPLPADVLR